MGFPEITEDQREMAIVMLANALRKDAHVRARAYQRREQRTLWQEGILKRRAAPSQRYVEGMHDLLRVLFPNGQAVAEECLEEAYARAMGASVAVIPDDDGTRYH